MSVNLAVNAWISDKLPWKIRVGRFLFPIPSIRPKFVRKVSSFHEPYVSVRKIGVCHGCERNSEQRIVVVLVVSRGLDFKGAWRQWSGVGRPLSFSGARPFVRWVRSRWVRSFVRSFVDSIRGTRTGSGKAFGQLSPRDPFHITIFPPVSTFFI